MKHFDHVLHSNHILNHILLFEKSSAWKIRGNAETAFVTPDLHAKPVDLRVQGFNNAVWHFYIRNFQQACTNI